VNDFLFNATQDEPEERNTMRSTKRKKIKKGKKKRIN
jgi:hypothetical protein